MIEMDEHYRDCSDEPRTHVIVFWEIGPQSIFIDVVCIGMNSDMSITESTC